MELLFTLNLYLRDTVADSAGDPDGGNNLIFLVVSNRLKCNTSELLQAICVGCFRLGIFLGPVFFYHLNHLLGCIVVLQNSVVVCIQKMWQCHGSLDMLRNV